MTRANLTVALVGADGAGKLVARQRGGSQGDADG